MQSVKEEGVCRIMCLGESTTQNQYPAFLEEILNRRDIGVRFSVIDKGLVCATTMAILSSLEINLDKYRPDIVVTMMGCNDEGVKYYQDILKANTWIFQHCRLYRFARTIYMHILKKIKKEGIYGLNKLGSGRKARLGNRGIVVEKINLLNEWPIEKALKLNSKDDKKNPGSRSSYLCRSKLFEVEESLKKAIELSPKNSHAYVELGWFYRDQGKFSQAEESLKKAIELNPKNDSTYMELCWIYKVQGKLVDSEQILKKAIDLNPENGNVYNAILVLCEEIGKPVLAKKYAEKINRSKLWYYNLVTVNNYRKLREILDKRGIRLVSVQYPMRNVEPLKKIFEKDKGIVFVDNKNVFKKALKKASYREYFVDMFAGDFGHCTEKGNRLLAQNIAKAILKDIFGK